MRYPMMKKFYVETSGCFYSFPSYRQSSVTSPSPPIGSTNLVSSFPNKGEKTLPPKRVRSKGARDLRRIFQSESSSGKEVVITFPKGFLVRKSDQDLLNLIVAMLPPEDENRMANNSTSALMKQATAHLYLMAQNCTVATKIVKPLEDKKKRLSFLNLSLT